MGQLRFGAIATTKEKRMCGSRDDRNAISNCHRRRIMPASITLTVLQLCLIILSVSKVAIAGSRWHVGPEWYNDISAKGPGVRHRKRRVCAHMFSAQSAGSADSTMHAYLHGSHWFGEGHGLACARRAARLHPGRIPHPMRSPNASLIPKVESPQLTGC